MLVNDAVAPAIRDAFESGPAGRWPTGCWPRCVPASAPAARRGELRSAALLIVERESFPLVDLRVDDDSGPLDRLDALWDAYRPLARGVRRPGA